MNDAILCCLEAQLAHRAFHYATTERDDAFFERAVKLSKAYKAGLRTAAALQFDGCNVVTAAVLSLIKAECELEQARELYLDLICMNDYTENRKAHAPAVATIEGWKSEAFAELGVLRSCLRDKLDVLLFGNDVHPAVALFLRLHSEEAPPLKLSIEYVPSQVLPDLVAYVNQQSFARAMS